MSTVIITAAVAAILAVAALIVVLFRRRSTPRLRFELDAVPEADNLLPSLVGITGGTVYQGNQTTVLQNGALFPALLEDIANAERTVHLETFVWSSGEVERKLVGALGDKARQGVAVRVLIDAVGGTKADAARLDALRASGAAVVLYCPPRFNNWRRFNQRTHRKLLIVDGRVGYTFGHGVADQWLGDAQDADHWRDTGLRLAGPAARGLQTVFAENWIEESHELLFGDGCFPVIDEQGDSQAHVVSSASGDALSNVSMTYTLAIAAARREIIMQNPYFAPDSGVVDLLAAQVERGVTVSLMVPGQQTDSPLVRRAGCYLYDRLLAAGVRLYEYQRTLNHQKIMIIDGRWSHIGSTNFDARSLELNEEVSVGLIDDAVAAELKAAFDNDLQHCRELTLDQWRQRPRRARLIEAVAYALHEQL